MSVAQRIARNSLVLLVGQILTYVLSFFVVMYLARYLGPGPYGILSFGLAFTAIFGVVPDLGLSFLTVREVTRDKSLAAKYLANVGLMKVILAGVAFGLIALTMNVGKAVIGYPQQTITIVYLLGLSVVITGLNQMCYSIFRAFERMEYQSLGQILHAALMLAGVILAIKYGFGLVGFASLYFYASLVTLVYSLTILVWKFSRYHIWSHLRTQVDWSSWKPTLTEYAFGLPFALKNVARLLVGGAVMGLFVWYFQDLNLAILVSLSALVYTMVILLMRTFDSTDFHILTSIVKGEAVLTKLDSEWTN